MGFQLLRPEEHAVKLASSDSEAGVKQETKRNGEMI